MELRGTTRTLMKRLDRIAGEVNAWLLLLAIGLGVLDVTVMVALLLPKPTPISERADRANTER